MPGLMARAASCQAVCPSSATKSAESAALKVRIGIIGDIARPRPSPSSPRPDRPTAPGSAMCVTPVVAAAPCQCFSPGGIQIDVARAHLLDGSALTLNPADTGGHHEHLTDRMRVPGGTSAGLEGDAAAGHARRRGRREEHVDAHRPCEVFGGPSGRGLRTWRVRSSDPAGLEMLRKRQGSSPGWRAWYSRERLPMRAGDIVTAKVASRFILISLEWEGHFERLSKTPFTTGTAEKALGHPA